MLADNVRHLRRSAERNGLTSMVVVLGAVSDRNDPVGVGGTKRWGRSLRQHRCSARR